MRNTKFVRALLFFVAVAAAGIAGAAEQHQVVNVAGIQSYDLQGEAGNTVIELNLGALAQVTSISWNYDITAHDPSWLADMQVSFTSSSGDGVVFTASATAESGSEHQEGSADLGDLGLAFKVGADGKLRLEFSESFKDLAPGQADGQWDAGSFTIGYVSAVPEPSTYAMMMLGLLAVGAAARRRQR
ncbi:PEP-CTERM sorting domain-containing protein [Duganella vulcania]|uniref:PEP-CTERM sorting domain-containing protein n=1 Tax=Duganella vulcania TaxID=2692166 RepID=A0A845GU79_9BURK|nr:PEP-CTERM sorting domain-containing protein [Duganella vulcania]MYM96788.1 PEP-CTERM sorting domain-containing protein [Duganella vulcania]